MEPFVVNAYLAGVAIIFIFFVGFVAGREFGLIREKRREFNLVAGSLRDELTSGFNTALSQFPNLSPEQEKLIFSMMSPFHQQVFHKAYTIYLNAINATAVTQPGEILSSTDVHLIEKHFRKVIDHLRDK